MKQVLMTEKSFAVRDIARKLMSHHGLGGWHLAFNHSMTTLGRCVYPHVSNGYVGRIELSVPYVETNPLECVRDTILHEIAHALAGEGTGHGPEWQAVCKKIGAKPERCKPLGQVVIPTGRWRARCPGCSLTHQKVRKPRRMTGWYCLACGPEKGPLSWADSRLGQ